MLFEKSKRGSVRERRGFTLVETLVGVFLLAILSLGIYGSYAFGLKMSTQNRLRVQATAVAEKKIESIKAMDYNDIGTAGNIPNGFVPEQETETVDQTTFTTRVNIEYVDDPYDDVFPTDIIPSDYKKVEVRVDWPTNLESKEIILTTVISPPKIETSLGTGVLVINTVDGEGLPVPGCSLRINNSASSPPINLEEETDENGTFTLVGVPSQIGSFEIIVEKEGYDGARTYPPYPESSFNPIDAHITIAEGKITSKTFVIDKTGTMILNFKDTLGANVSGATFSLTGGRVIGTTVAATPLPVYAYNETDLSSNENGVWQQSDLGKGPYAFTFTTNPTYEVIVTDLLSPWSLDAESTRTVNLVLGEKTRNILVIRVKNRTGGAPIESALVNVKDASNVLFQEKLTDANGYVYFPQIEDPAKAFSNARYNLTITKSGFRDLTDSVTFTGGIIRKDELIRK